MFKPGKVLEVYGNCCLSNSESLDFHLRNTINNNNSLLFGKL